MQRSGLGRDRRAQDHAGEATQDNSQGGSRDEGHACSRAKLPKDLMDDRGEECGLIVEALIERRPITLRASLLKRNGTVALWAGVTGTPSLESSDYARIGFVRHT